MKRLTSYLSKAALAGVVYAQEKAIDITPPEGWENLANITLPGIVSTLIKLILIVAAIIAFIFLVIGGIKWITSGGDKEATSGAQKTITAALIGLIIVFAAWAIIKLLETFFNIKILSELKIPQIPPSQ